MPQPRRAPRRAGQPQAQPPAPQQAPQPSSASAPLIGLLAGPVGLLAVGTIGVAAGVGEVRSTAVAARRLVGLPSLRYVADQPLAARDAQQVAVIVANGLAGAASTIRDPALLPDVQDAALHARADTTDAELDVILRQERARARTFTTRQARRVRRDVHRALREPDDARRQRRLEILASNERRWTQMHHLAATRRAAGYADALNVADLDPECAVWEMGPRVHHTPDCAFLHGKALRWEALRSTRMIPPIHAGCGCRLRPRDEAWRLGLTAELLATPTVRDSLGLIARARSLTHDAPRGSLLEAEAISGAW